MVISMTGYGRGFAEEQDLRIHVEIKTVNHRFTEYQIRMPRQLLFLEDKIKKQVSEYIKRGRAEVFITLEGSGLTTKKLEVDWELADEYVSLMSKVQQKYNLASKPDLGDFLQLDDVITVVEQQADQAYLEDTVLSAVKEASSGLFQMRQLEGAQLAKDMLGHLSRIRSIVEKLEILAPAVAENYRNRLYEKISDYTNGMLDEARLLTEAAIFAEKADINEELTRLESHISQFEKTLAIREPVGRKLDFLVQEMNRETNTIGSKANDSSIAQEVVEVKSLLEKIKEQVQNIE
ncbi:YicC/YloC family endoribonuclease [Peribacillus deserti]|uniref:YicC family protein n=1 Tax=Peribacillus deserti TaxID=673318 RepID=A0A2N5M721_9BACI|nr:YicC/YloC family endoribonuclease [Peribacillus deserti]PLT30122.1 YicC family protein [Peribacillus deserti]